MHALEPVTYLRAALGHVLLHTELGCFAVGHCRAVLTLLQVAHFSAVLVTLPERQVGVARVQVAAAQLCYIVAGGALHWAPEPGDPSGKLCLVGAGEELL